MKTTKRHIAYILALLLCLSMLPFSVYAGETETTPEAEQECDVSAEEIISSEDRTADSDASVSPVNGASPEQGDVEASISLVITGQPESVYVSDEGTATFFVQAEAVGDGDAAADICLNYQWQVLDESKLAEDAERLEEKEDYWTDIPESSSTLVIEKITEENYSDSYENLIYRCVVSAENRAVISDEVRILGFISIQPVEDVIASLANGTLESAKIINPLYQDVITEDDIPDEPKRRPLFAKALFSSSAQSSFSEDETIYSSLPDAGSVVRAALMNRDENVSIYYSSPDSVASLTLAEQIYSEAVKHTGVPDEGDYYRFGYGGYRIAYYETPQTFENDPNYYYKFIYYPLYYTTASQEAEMDTAVDAVLKQLELSEKNDYEKIKAIYDYLCANVTYDNANVNNKDYVLKYTGYAALVNKTAVCQGYSVAFYRLCLEAGIDARIISSTEMCHAWNIAALEGKYYELDSTWDAGRTFYLYFLKGSTSWLSNHTSKGTGTLGDQYADSSFASKYQIPAEDYQPPEVCYSGSCGAYATWVLDSKGVLTISGTGSMYDYGSAAEVSGTFTPVPWNDQKALVKSAVIKSGIVGIGSSAFQDCTNLISVTLPNGIETIGAGCFMDCPALKAITIPASVKTIEDNAFAYCSEEGSTQLGKVVFLGNAPTMGENCFYNVTAEVYYQENNITWTKDVLSSYIDALSGSLTFTPYCHIDNKGVPVVEHTEQIAPRVAPSDTETGLTEEVTCSKCGIIIESRKLIPWTITYILNDERAENTPDNPVEYHAATGEVILKHPRLNGYTFVGWYLDEALTMKASVPQITAESKGNKTFYAKWVMNTYTVRFNSNGGTGSMRSISGITDAGCQINIKNGFKRTGCTLTGFNTLRDGSGAGLTDSFEIHAIAPYADGRNTITLYAQWRWNEYTVSFDANGGSGTMEPQQFVYGTPENLKSCSFEKIGYTFNGWKSGRTSYKDGQTIRNLSSSNGAQFTFTAQWKANSFKIAFDPNGGTGKVKPITATYGKASSKLPSSGYKYSGLVLKGWSTTPHTYSHNGCYSMDFKCGTAIPADKLDGLYAASDFSDITLYAVWGPAEYKITYKNLPSYGKTSLETLDNSMNPVLFNMDSCPELQAPVVPGYSFEGWYTNSRLTTAVTDQFWTAAAKTVYAKIVPITYTISYDFAKGTASVKANKTSYSIKTSISLNSPTRFGYTFAGWYLDETKVTRLSAGTYYGGDLELVARWTPNSYTLVLNGNGGSVSVQSKFTGLNTESVVTLPQLDNRGNLSFEGWATKKNGTGDFYFPGDTCICAAKNKSTITLYAVWKSVS